MAGMGQRQGQGRRQPGIVRDKGERQHHADRVDRQRQILQRPGEGGQRIFRLHAQPDDGQQGGEQNGGAGCRQPVEFIHRGVGRRGANHRRHTGNHFVEEWYRNIDNEVIHRAARSEQRFEWRHAPQGHGGGQEQERRPGADHLSRRVACAGQRHIHLRGAEIAEAEDAYRLPAFEEQGQTDQGDQRRDDIRQLRAKEVRAEVLGNSERTACDYHRRPGLFNAAPAVHNRHDPEQHDNGQERQLAAHHLADGEAIDTGHLAGDQNRDAHRAEGHRRGVDDQAQASRIQRVKPETNQQRGGNRDRCAETRRPFEKGAEREADDQHLQALVRCNRQNR